MKAMKQSQLAKQLGISKSYLSMILSGQRTPNPELADRISSQSSLNSKAKFCSSIKYTQYIGDRHSFFVIARHRVPKQSAIWLSFLGLLRSARNDRKRSYCDVINMRDVIYHLCK